MQNPFKKPLELLKESFTFASDKINDGLQKIGSIGNDTRNKFSDYAKSIIIDLPLLEKAGYRTIQVEAGISIPPSLEIHFKKIKDLTNEELAEIREEFKSRKTILLILNALIKANSFQQAISNEKFKSDIITIDITVPPEVKVKFKRVEQVELPPSTN